MGCNKYQQDLSRYRSAEREYQRQKKKARDHRTACLATSWIPLVNIGTCVASAVYTGHRNSAAKKKNASYRRYKNAQDYHKYYQEKIQEYNAQLKQLAQSMADSQRQLSIYSGRVREFDRKEKALSKINTNLKNACIKMREIVTASQVMTANRGGVRSVVSKMNTLVQGIQLVITRIKEGRQLLGISAANIRMIEASYDALLTSAGTYVNKYQGQVRKISKDLSRGIIDVFKGKNVFQAMKDYLGA